MDAAKVFSALNSVLRREILKILVGTSYTVKEVLNSLRKKGLDVKYRETVYRALEKLVDSEIIEKFYVKERGLCYTLSSDHITIEISKESIRIVK